MRPLLLDKSTTRRCAAVLTRLLTFSNVGSKSSNHQLRGVTRTIRQSPDTNGGPHNNNEELDVCAEALGSHFCQGLVFVERGQASSSLMSKDPSSPRNNASCRWLPRSPWGCCALWHTIFSVPRRPLASEKSAPAWTPTSSDSRARGCCTTLGGAQRRPTSRPGTRSTLKNGVGTATHNFRTDPQAC